MVRRMRRLKSAALAVVRTLAVATARVLTTANAALLSLLILRTTSATNRSAALRPPEPLPRPGGGLPYLPSLRRASTNAASVIARAVLTRTKRSR